jgi:hypothetical protein
LFGIISKRKRTAQPAKIGPTLVAGCQKIKGSVAKINLQTDDRLNSILFAGSEKLNRACQQIVIGETNSRHPMSLSCLHQVGRSH